MGRVDFDRETEGAFHLYFGAFLVNLVHSLDLSECDVVAVLETVSFVLHGGDNGLFVLGNGGNNRASAGISVCVENSVFICEINEGETV